MDYAHKIKLAQYLDRFYDNSAVEVEYYGILKKKSGQKGQDVINRWDKVRMQIIIEDVKACKVKNGKKYDVIKENGVEVLILKRPYRINPDNIYRKVMGQEESYNILSKAHRHVNHQGYKEIFTCLRERWSFPIGFVHILVAACNVCKILNNTTFERTDFEDASEFKKMWRINFITMKKECPYILTPKYILCCEDAMTEFLIIRPLNNISIEEISKQLLKIFLIFGAPKTITGNNIIIREMIVPALDKIINCHPQFAVKTYYNGSAAAISKSLIIDTLKSWIEEVEVSNYEIDCEIGCHVVQRKLNTRLRVIQRKRTNKYIAFIPHNLFMKQEIKLDSWDSEVIKRDMIKEEKEPESNKRKLEGELNVSHKKPTFAVGRM